MTRPNVKTYTALLYAFHYTKQVDAAHTLYTTLREKNFPLDDVFLRVLLKVFRHANKSEWIDEVVSHQREKREGALEATVSARERELEANLIREATENKRREGQATTKDAQVLINGKPVPSKHTQQSKQQIIDPQTTYAKPDDTQKQEEEVDAEVVTNFDNKKYDMGIYSEEADTAFQPVVASKLFELAVQRHLDEAKARKPQKPQQTQDKEPQQADTPPQLPTKPKPKPTTTNRPERPMEKLLQKSSSKQKM